MSGLTSDDFSGAALDGRWSLEGPAGSANLGAANGEAYVELVVPQGNFDPYHVNRAVRLMQDAPDEDFGVERDRRRREAASPLPPSGCEDLQDGALSGRGDPASRC